MADNTVIEFGGSCEQPTKRKKVSRSQAKRKSPDKLEFKREVTGDCYYGTQEQLVTAGLATHDQFPGQPGRPKISVRLFGGTIVEKKHKLPSDGNWKIITKYSKNRFLITCGITEAERKNRLEQNAAMREMAERRSYCEGVAEVIRERTADDCRQSILCSVDFIGEQLEFGDRGYRFSAVAINQAMQKLAELKLIFANGKIIFDQAERDAAICEIFAREGLEPPALESLKKPRPTLRIVK